MLIAFSSVQKTDGSFGYGKAFLRELNMQEKDIQEEADDLGYPVDLFMTLVAIVFIRSMLS